MTPAIHIQKLNFYFGEGELRFQVLKHIDLRIEPGEIVIMTGPSGSGKTTLLTIIGGLRKAEEGSVKILGKELVGSDDATRMAIRRQIGFIFQQHNLMDSLTALQNVCLTLELHDGVSEAERQARGSAMLKAVGLGNRIHYKPQQLSGGQRQRVSIARALVGNPKLILADEPTASLDKKSGQEAVEILQRLAREQGCTILLVTHDYRILDMADRVVTLEDGIIAPVNATVSA
jgi:putative ABC transport system ATP-binding protein